MKTTTLFLLLTISIVKLQAQACSQCNNDFINNSKDYFKTTYSNSQESLTALLFESDYEFWSSYNSNSSDNTELGGAYKFFKANYSNGSKTSVAREKYEMDRKNYKETGFLSQLEMMEIAKSTVPKEIIASWENCIKTTCAVGIFLDVESVSEKRIVVSMFWKPENIGVIQDTFNITNVISDNCSFEQGDIIKNGKISPFTTLISSFKIDDITKPSSINVSVEGFASTFKVKIPPFDANKAKPLNWDFKNSVIKYNPYVLNGDTTSIEPAIINYSIPNVISISTINDEKSGGTVYIAAKIKIPSDASELVLENGPGLISANSFNSKDQLYTAALVTLRSNIFGVIKLLGT